MGSFDLRQRCLNQAGWGGAVSGKLGQPTDNGFEVVDAGIKVFEKKANVPKLDDTTIKADAAPIV
jgi:hypothetical protein